MCTQSRCENPEEFQKPHVCPYKVEIQEDSETLCTCCKSCFFECKDNV